MGRIAPPLAHPVLGSITTKNIPSDARGERTSANMMEQGMSDDCRLGLAKNQQWAKTNPNSRIVVSNYGKSVHQKIDTFPTEVSIVEPDLPPVYECTCWDLSKVVTFITWSGIWDDSEIFLDFTTTYYNDPPRLEIVLYQWLNYFADTETLLSADYNCKMEYRLTNSMHGAIRQNMRENIACVFYYSDSFAALDPKPDMEDSPIYLYCNEEILTQVSIFYT